MDVSKQYVASIFGVEESQQLTSYSTIAALWFVLQQQIFIESKQAQRKRGISNR
jgi:hypothetical protein